jgi:transposase
MSRLQLTSWQRHCLRRELTQTRDARLYRRLLAVLEYDRGRPVADIAHMLGMTRQSIYNWVEVYLQNLQPAALDDAEHSGRPRLLSEDDEDLLETLLAISPQDLGYPDTTWTVPRLQEALAASTGQRFSDDTIRRALRRLRFLWKRPRYVLEPDPEREKKRPDPTANPGTAGAQRRAGARRNRPAVVPTAAGGMVQARHGGAGLVERSQCSADHLRGHEPANRGAVVLAAREGTQR